MPVIHLITTVSHTIAQSKPGSSYFRNQCRKSYFIISIIHVINWLLGFILSVVSRAIVRMSFLFFMMLSSVVRQHYLAMLAHLSHDRPYFWVMFPPLHCCGKCFFPTIGSCWMDVFPHL